MKKWLSLTSTILAISVFFTGCSSKESSDATKSTEQVLQVYTTIFPLQDFTQKIGGKYVHVEAIYPAGADTHTYEPGQKQMVTIAKSDLFIYNGAGLEAFAEKMETTLKNENVKVVDSSAGVDLISFTEHEDEHEEEGHDSHEEETNHDQDPHIWLDPTLAIKQAENIKNALVQLQPDHKAEFEKNFKDLQTQLIDLDTQFKDTVNNAKTKEILVSHAAYGYWEHRYGLKQIPITGLSSAAEPSQKQLAEVAELAKEHNLKYILFESFATPKVAEVVQKETGTKILRLNHLSTISEDDIKNNKDYFQLMQENLTVLKTAMNP